MSLDPPSVLRPSPSGLSESSSSYDAILLLSFGGPEQPEDVMPFLENVVRGKDVPRERLVEVAKHYELFDGVSPINGHLRVLLTTLVDELNSYGLQLPVYWGNRNWHPMLADTVQDMADDGVRHALAFVTSAFGSYPGCRQYLEDIEGARRQVGHRAPRIDKLRLFYNHPGFIEAMADRVTAAALHELSPKQRSKARLIFTAHSIPMAMAEHSPYERQLREACRLVVEWVRIREDRRTREDKHLVSPTEEAASQPETGKVHGEQHVNGFGAHWQLVYQSRSGPPSQPWLGPDIRDYLRQLHETGDVEDVIVVPIGFLVEHMEVAYDLDCEVGELCDELGLNLIRAGVVGSHPRCVQMIRDLIVERIDPLSPRQALGPDGPWPDECGADCCR